MNYDRVLEDRVLTAAATTGERRFRASIPTAMWFGLRYVWRRIRGKGMRFGHAAVGFGQPMSLTQALAGHRGNAAAAVGEDLMTRIRDVVPVLPVPLVAHVMRDAGQPVSRAGLIERVADLMGRLNAPMAVTDPEAAVAAGLATLETRRILSEVDGVIAVPPGQETLVTFYADSIAHHLNAVAAKEPGSAVLEET